MSEDVREKALAALQNAKEPSSGAVNPVEAGSRVLTEAEADAMGAGSQAFGGVNVNMSAAQRKIHETDMLLAAQREAALAELASDKQARLDAAIANAKAPQGASRDFSPEHKERMVERVAKTFARTHRGLHKSLRSKASTVGFPMPPRRLGGAWEEAWRRVKEAVDERDDALIVIVETLIDSGRSWGQGTLTSSAISILFFQLLIEEFLAVDFEREEPSDESEE